MRSARIKTTLIEHKWASVRDTTTGAVARQCRVKLAAACVRVFFLLRRPAGACVLSVGCHAAMARQMYCRPRTAMLNEIAQPSGKFSCKRTSMRRIPGKLSWMTQNTGHWCFLAQKHCSFIQKKCRSHDICIFQLE